MNNPFFSIIIPTYNRAAFIHATIKSVLAQEFRDFELLIVDDGSTDNTSETIRQFKDDRIFYMKKNNEERAAARNKGAKNAKGRYLNFLDSDDTLYPNHLTEAHQFILKQGDLEIFHIGYDVKDFSGKLVKKMDNIRNVNKQILSGNVLSCNGVFIRKEIFQENSFNEDRALSSLEDWELWIRMSSRFKFFNVNKITSTIVLHDNRSVVTGDPAKIKLKGARFIKYVSEDAENRKVYLNQLKKIFSSINMYTALHLAMSNHSPQEIIYYVRKGLRNHMGSLFTKRFLVILRLLILSR